MKTRDDSRQAEQIFPRRNILGGFVLVLVIFGGYAYFLKEKENRTQELFWGELRYLRQENRTFAEKIQELEQQCGAVLPEESLSQNSRSADENVSEAALETERSFVYHVKRGDTIWDIAEIYQVDVESLMRWNKLTPRSRIFPGDRLTIILEE